MDNDKSWKKFHPLWENTLKVALESNYPTSEDLSFLDSQYKKNGMVHKNFRESVARVYEPATAVVGDYEKNNGCQIVFQPLQSPKILFRRLMFSRKIDNNFRGKIPRYLMAAARHYELFTFGFDGIKSRNLKYLSLAYPGRISEDESGSLIFTPVFFKIYLETQPIYLEVWAWDKDDKTIVQARRVNENENPMSLRMF